MFRIFVLLLLCSQVSFANEARERLNPVRVDTPRATVFTFMTSMNRYLLYRKNNPSRSDSALKRASKTLNYKDVSPAFRQEVATSVPVYLKEVIDRVTPIDYSKIPNDSELEYWTLKDTAISIKKVLKGPNAGKYLFSPYTVENASDFFHRVEDLPYVVNTLKGAGYQKPWIESKIPPYLKVKLWGFQRWKFLGLFVYVLFGFILKVLVRIFLSQLEKLTTRSKIQWDDKVIHAISNPLVWFVEGLYYYMGIRVLAIDGRWLGLFQSILVAYIAITVVWAVYNLVDIWIAYLTSLSRKRNYAIDDQLIPIIQKSVKFFVAAFGTLMTLQNIGINVMSVVAGLGLGGLAFALAAKDTAANLFGSIMIFSDRPFRVGDWVSFNNMEGIVENIGLRSTRIRSFANSLITIPNAIVANESIDNLGLRQYRRFKTEIGITYGTSMVDIERFIVGIKEIIENHEHTRKDNYHVALNSFGDSSLNILMYLYLRVPDYGMELKVKEEIILAIISLAESLGVSFAFPSRSIYIESDPRSKSEDKSN